jgi:hypothetical protein
MALAAAAPSAAPAAAPSAAGARDDGPPPVAPAAAPPRGDGGQRLIIVLGAPGTPEYGEEFRRWAGLWSAAAERAGIPCARVGFDLAGSAGGDGAVAGSAGGAGSTGGAAERDRERLQAALAAEARESSEPLWIVLLGHGTFDGREAKFNLRGPDVAAADLAAWLEPFARPLAVINCASASSPFVNRLSAPERVVVTATKSGHEQNYARFGGYLAAAIADPAADLDKDGQTSLLEAFLAASARTAEFYDGEARLATEHALIDDNGDGLGTPAAWFRGVRATKEAKGGTSLDGARANQVHLVRAENERELPAAARARRDALEVELEGLRARKAELGEDAYYRELERLFLELARIYKDAEAAVGE